ncbi:hypothetical protein B0H14DRAFT_2571863 [Mycena olivaceomarginata]|nr:hypothetical protein B0H14DRAFT_2571863 [Mycena olivaceomarginata]
MFRLANLFDLGQQICKVFDVATFYATGMSVWAPPPGLLVSPQPDRAPGERPELLPQPSDATKHWYYYGCLACDEIRVNKLVVASLCTPEELAQEPYKSMGNSARLLKHSLECEMQYYKAYSSKLEEQLHRVRGERRFITGKLKKTQTTLFVLQKEVAALGATLLEHAEVKSRQFARSAEEPRNVLTSLLQEHVRFLGEKLVELAGDSGEEGVHDEECETSTSFSILST